MQLITRFKRGWKNTPWKGVILAGIILVILAIGISLFAFRADKEPKPAQSIQNVQSVQVATLPELQQQATLTRTGLLMPAIESPIIARVGGRITNLNIAIGDSVAAGTILGKIDGGNEPNPTAAQARSASNVLALFKTIETQSLVSAENAVALAQQNLQAARAGQHIGLDTQSTSIDITSNALDQALLAARNAEETDIDATIDAAELGVEAAQLARDLAQDQAAQQNRAATDALATATLNIRTAEIARERTRAELASQRSQLAGQLEVAQEQLRLQDLLAATDGTVLSLNAQIGDFVSPNQEVGTISQVGSGRVELDLPAIIANSLQTGDLVSVKVNGTELTASVQSVADATATTGLFETVFHIESGVPSDGYGKQATIEFSPKTPSNSQLLPLDAVVVRSDGPVVFTSSSAGTAVEKKVTIKGYYGNFVEVIGAFNPNDQIIITNTRLLFDGATVEVIPKA